MIRAVVNEHGRVRLATLDDEPGRHAEDPVEVALLTAGVQPKDRQSALGQVRASLPPRFVAGSQAVVQRVDDGTRHFCRASIDAAGGLRDGVYADRFVAERRWLVPMPGGLDAVVAAAGTDALADALYALDDLGGLPALDPSATVLVLGSSTGVGAAAVDVALRRGHAVVAATRDVRSVAPRDRLTVTTYDDLTTAVRAASGGHGAALTVDNVGGALTALGLRAAARRGRHVLVGYLAGRELALGVADLIPTEVALVGMNSGAVPEDRQRALVAEALDLLVRGVHRPAPVVVRPLAEGVDALVGEVPRGRTVLIGTAYECLDPGGGPS